MTINWTYVLIICLGIKTHVSVLQGKQLMSFHCCALCMQPCGGNIVYCRGLSACVVSKLFCCDPNPNVMLLRIRPNQVQWCLQPLHWGGRGRKPALASKPVQVCLRLHETLSREREGKREKEKMRVHLGDQVIREPINGLRFQERKSRGPRCNLKVK